MHTSKNLLVPASRRPIASLQATHQNMIITKKAATAAYNENQAAARRDATTQYYRHHDIDKAAKKKSVRYKAAALLYTGRIPQTIDLIRNVEFLRTELPIRVAHRIHGFRSLPFIVIANPNLLKVMELYIRSFKIITKWNNGRKITTEAEMEEFSNVLELLSADHANVIDDLIAGFREANDHIVQCSDGDEERGARTVKAFLDRSLTSRLGIRMLIQHHLLMKESVGSNSKVKICESEKIGHRDRIGIIESKWKPSEEIQKTVSKIREMYQFTPYADTLPHVQINGHVGAEFPYMPTGIEYILQEILKNSFRAVCETHMGSTRNMPAINATIAVNPEDFVIRIQDRGKGIPPGLANKIWHYNFTTAHGSNEELNKGGASAIMSMMNSENEKALAGYGVGLPISRAYAEYLGGSLEIKSMYGIGCDVFLQLKHIDPHRGHSFRI